MRERFLRDLGELAIDMHRSDQFDDELMRRKAAAVSGLEAEMKNVRRAARL